MTDEVVFVMLVVFAVVLGRLIEVPDDGELDGTFWADGLFSFFASRLTLSLLLQERGREKLAN